MIAWKNINKLLIMQKWCYATFYKSSAFSTVRDLWNWIEKKTSQPLVSCYANNMEMTEVGKKSDYGSEDEFEGALEKISILIEISR